MSRFSMGQFFHSLALALKNFPLLRAEATPVRLMLPEHTDLPPLNPVKGVSFEDFLARTGKAEDVKESILRQANISLGSSGLVITNILSIANAKSMGVVEFTAEISKQLKDGTLALMKDKSGRELAIAVTNDGTHRIVSHGRIVQAGGSFPWGASLNLVVGAAHLISNYDNAQKLKKIDRKLDQLITGRSNELIAELEACFESLRETLMSATVDKTHVRHIAHKLKFLRSVWVRDVTSSLSLIEDPESASLVTKIFSFKKTRAGKVEAGVSVIQVELQLIRVALSLEMIAMCSLQEGHIFNTVTIPTAAGQVQRVSDLIQERREWIRKLVGGEAVDDSIASCTDFMRSLSSGEDSPQLLLAS